MKKQKPQNQAPDILKKMVKEQRRINQLIRLYALRSIGKVNSPLLDDAIYQAERDINENAKT